MLKPDGVACPKVDPLDVSALERLSRREAARLLADAASRDTNLRRRLVQALESTRRAQSAQEVFAAGAEAEPVSGDSFMIGASAAMLDVFERLRRYASVESPVLVTGESGTGKELAARAIHERSARAAGPFVAINCAALPPSLVSSELFGHEKGAFTGAADRRIGHVELAHRGTLFLDEIGDLPLEIQGHLLRFLQDGQVLRIGARQPVGVDVRIIAATHVPLAEAVAERRFREDLFYRLAVLTLEMPPLRARATDIDLLATIFLRRIAAECGRSCEGFAPGALEVLRNYPWPGNVRQLIAVIRRAVVMRDDGPLRGEDFALDPLPARDSAAPGAAEKPPPGSEAERRSVLEALRSSGGQVARAARALGVSRVTLYRMIERNGIVLQR